MAYTMFSQRVNKKEHKTRMLRLLRLMTENGLRGSPVYKQQQCYLARNRYRWKIDSPFFQGLLAQHGLI